MKMLAAFVLLALVLVGCSVAGPYAVKEAEVTDYVNVTEERANGTYVIWVRFDTTAAYCTNNEALFLKAQQLRERQVYVTIKYNTINAGDRDGKSLMGIGGGGCDSEGEDVQMYRLLSIREANGE